MTPVAHTLFSLTFFALAAMNQSLLNRWTDRRLPRVVRIDRSQAPGTLSKR